MSMKTRVLINAFDVNELIVSMACEMESNLLCIDESNRKPVHYNNVDNDADTAATRCHICGPFFPTQVQIDYDRN